MDAHAVLKEHDPPGSWVPTGPAKLKTVRTGLHFDDLSQSASSSL